MRPDHFHGNVVWSFSVVCAILTVYNVNSLYANTALDECGHNEIMAATIVV